MAKSRDADSSALALFAAELQAARSRAGLTRDELAAKINYSASLIGMIESLKRVPQLDFARRCDKAFGTTGSFERIHEYVRLMPFASWFRPFAQYEADATAIRAFELTVVPGLLQTEAYARTLLSARIGAMETEIEEQLSARLQRQAILDRDNPPVVWVLLDEGVVRRPVGGRGVMRDQIEHLIEMAARSNIVIQVIPAEIGAHDGVNGSFVIADFEDAPSIVYLENALTGMIVEKREDVAAITLTYDGLRSQALSRAATVELLKEVAKSWT
jgi:transcriptional regulator with XRE-family HTH domain